MPLIEIAQKIHKEIEKLGGESAFPVNLSIDDIAAHYHPTLEDETKVDEWRKELGLEPLAEYLARLKIKYQPGK